MTWITYTPFGHVSKTMYQYKPSSKLPPHSFRPLLNPPGPSSPVTTVWVTKWWRTKGIIKAERTVIKDGEVFTPIWINWRKVGQRLHMFNRNQWYENRDDAVAYVEKLRKKYLRRLEIATNVMAARTFDKDADV